MAADQAICVDLVAGGNDREQGWQAMTDYLKPLMTFCEQQSPDRFARLPGTLLHYLLCIKLQHRQRAPAQRAWRVDAPVECRH
jgi:hypothetical protein